MDFSNKVYSVRQNIFSFLGATVRVLDESDNQVLYVRQKALKLKEDIRVYKDETKQEEIFQIKARNIIDFSATYDIFDTTSGGQKVGALRRKGLKSLFQDSWLVLDANDQEIGQITEDSALMAILRRFLSSLIPQKFNVTMNGQNIAEFKRAFNPFVNKMKVDFSADSDNKLDHRLGLASALLIVLLENKG